MKANIFLMNHGVKKGWEAQVACRCFQQNSNVVQWKENKAMYDSANLHWTASDIIWTQIIVSTNLILEDKFIPHSGHQGGFPNDGSTFGFSL